VLVMEEKTVRSLQHSSTILELSGNLTFMSELEIASLIVLGFFIFFYPMIFRGVN